MAFFIILMFGIFPTLATEDTPHVTELLTEEGEKTCEPLHDGISEEFRKGLQDAVSKALPGLNPEYDCNLEYMARQNFSDSVVEDSNFRNDLQMDETSYEGDEDNLIEQAFSAWGPKFEKIKDVDKKEKYGCYYGRKGTGLTQSRIVCLFV
ncbi:hypothetical protein NECAME_16545 [Necator americanus]|uniref:SCP domain-containing protein n=1 Tax=Necator americanus TaxID=51031 RepID=W2TWD9_NECAM|nr:hypothetical protein NECAME_16545 [Necator americanus]ETN85994.1 hypothetical protein NECAME_16545 [Necator americanus]